MSTDDNDPMAAFARELFARGNADFGSWGQSEPEPEAQDAEQKRPSNHVPNEGKTPSVDDLESRTMRSFVRDIFGQPDF